MKYLHKGIILFINKNFIICIYTFYASEN
jgi:hypothetical protein